LEVRDFVSESEILVVETEKSDESRIRKMGRSDGKGTGLQFLMFLY